MFKNLLLLSIVVSLSACTAKLTEKGFITQDDNVVAYQNAELESWQANFSNHQIKGIKLRASSDNTLLKGLYFDHPQSRDVIFYIPGNGMKVAEGGVHAIRSLAKLGRDIVIFDRRGLGASEGQATIINLVSDAREQLNYIKQKMKPDNLILHGFSLGSFIAGQVAKSEQLDALVLQGSATNVDEWIDENTPRYTKPFLTIEVEDVFHTVDNKEVVSKHYSGPLFVIGAEEDEQTPVSLTHALFNASQSEQKNLTIVEGAHHNNMFANEPEIEKYRAFLTALKN